MNESRGEGVPERLATSALAKRLRLPVQQLFATLRDYGWIERRLDSWVLTPKGEFEGGTYIDSRRFGRYVAWPEGLAQHPLLAAIESNQRISAAGLVRYYPHLNPREINRALAEMGLQRHTLLGWELTELGKRFGGHQEESGESGALFVSWPHEIIDDPVVHRDLSRHSEHGAPIIDDQLEPDLFSQGPGGGRGFVGIDGHETDTLLQMRVCNWLYLAQLAHARSRPLPTVEGDQCADFYLPQGNVYIDCWGDETQSAAQLSGRLQRRESYRSLQLAHIELDGRDLDRLDEVLGGGLLALGIRC